MAFIFFWNGTQKAKVGKFLDPGGVTPTSRFAILTDIHVGDALQADLAAVSTYLNDQSVSGVLVLGDNTDGATEAQFTGLVNFLESLTSPYYIIPGSHDDGVGLDPGGGSGGVPDYTYYDANFSVDHNFSVDIGAFRLIGFETQVIRSPDTPTPNYAKISSTQLAYLESQLYNLDGKAPMLFTHYPFANMDDDHGRTELVDLCTTYGVKSLISGHIHSYSSGVYNGVNYITAPTLCNEAGHGLYICDVYANKIVCRLIDVQVATITPTYLSYAIEV